MKHMVLMALLVCGMDAYAGGVAMLSDLDELVWKNRVIVVNQPLAEREELRVLQAHVAGIDDREIIWFIVTGDRALTNYPGQLSGAFPGNLRERLGPAPGRVVLIGKDGGVKSGSDDLDLDAIFAQIDAMPMRQLEMRQ
jgi:hypothetical protein